MTRQQIEALVEHIRAWPKEDQDELFEIMRDIEARRSDVYSATAEELAEIDAADQSGLATDENVEAAFRMFRLG
jgi:hypothetical protein